MIGTWIYVWTIQRIKVKDNVILFLREREIVHFQQFGETLEICKEKMNQKNVYLYNPEFDKKMM